MLTIQGFNQAGQKAMGTIVLQMEIGELLSTALFHVIDAPTSYNVLLGRPWLHNYGIVPSTLHQCFKWLENGEVKMVVADTDPFKGEEVNYSDAKFYKPSDGPSVKEAPRPVLEAKKQEVPRPLKPRVKVAPQTLSSNEKAPSPEVSKPKTVFRYVKKDQREPGQKAITPIKDIMETLMTSYARPLRKINQSIPKSGIVISTTLDNGHSRYKQFVSFKSRKQKQAPTPLKINLGGRKTAPKAIPLKVTVK